MKDNTVPQQQIRFQRVEESVSTFKHEPWMQNFKSCLYEEARDTSPRNMFIVKQL